MGALELRGRIGLGIVVAQARQMQVGGGQAVFSRHFVDEVMQPGRDVLIDLVDGLDMGAVQAGENLRIDGCVGDFEAIVLGFGDDLHAHLFRQ